MIGRRFNVFGFALVAMVLVPAALSSAAQLLIKYDVDDPASWNGTTLSDTQGFSTALTPSAGVPRNDTGPAFVPGDFGAPVYQSSGAITSVSAPWLVTRNRAWLDFQKYGVLTGSNRDSSAFNTPAGGDDGTNANVAGFTAEGFFLVKTGYSAAENGGLGIGHGGPGVGMIRIPRGTGTTLLSNTSVDNLQGGPQGLENIDTNINAIIPLNQWFHFVKTHDVVSDTVKIYINGVLQSTTPLDGDSSAVEYHPGFTDQLGQVSQNFRELKNVGYSMTRFYRGALTDAEVFYNFREVAFPEPGSLALLGLGGVMMLRRRRASR